MANIDLFFESILDLVLRCMKKIYRKTFCEILLLEIVDELKIDDDIIQHKSAHNSNAISRHYFVTDIFRTRIMN